MTLAVKTSSLVDPSTWGLKPDYSAVLHYILENPDGSTDDREYVSFRGMLNDCFGSDIEEAIDALYASEGFKRSEDHMYPDEAYEDFYSKMFQEIAESLGYKIWKVIR